MNSPLNVPSRKRPVARTYEVEEIVEMALSGRIRVPEFQRGFKWTQRDAVKLFDSILKGYPLGNLLFWDRSASRQRITLGRVEIEGEEIESAYWVVDGQQRIASLVNSLTDKGFERGWKLGLDLATGLIGEPPAKPTASFLPLPILYDLPRLLKWFNDNPDQIHHLDTASRIATQIRQFRISASVVKADDEGILRDIFDRLNTYGKSLNRSEVFNALHPAESSGNAPASLGTIKDAIDARLDFGEVDEDTLLKCLLATRGADVTRDIHNEFNDEESRKTAYEKAETAVLRAILFLQEDCQIPQVAFLPYKYLLIVITRFFHFFPEVDEANKKTLTQWFWRAAVVGPGKGSVTGEMRRQCSLVEKGEVRWIVQNLFDSISADQVRQSLPTCGEFRTNHAEGKILACMYWQNRPRDLESEEEIPASALAETFRRPNSRSIRSVFPYLWRNRNLNEDLRASLGSRFLSVPSEDQPQVNWEYVSNRSIPYSEGVLKSQFITSELLSLDSIQATILGRNELMQSWIDKQIMLICGMNSSGHSLVDVELLRIEDE